MTGVGYWVMENEGKERNKGQGGKNMLKVMEPKIRGNSDH